MVDMPMSTRKMIVELPAEIFDEFKLACVKNHATIKDEVFKLICTSLEVESEPKTVKELQKTINILGKEYVVGLDGKAVVDDLDLPIVAPSIKREDLEAELKPIRQEIEKLKGSWEKSSGNCPKLPELDQKFLVLAKTLAPIMWVLKEKTGADICDPDVKALALLANEPAGKWTTKGQFDTLRVLLKGR